LQEQQELAAADGTGTVGQRVTPGLLVERVCQCDFAVKHDAIIWQETNDDVLLTAWIRALYSIFVFRLHLSFYFSMTSNPYQRLERVSNGVGGEADKSAVPLQQAGLSNMAAAAAAALNPNTAYHAVAAAGFADEGGIAARRMSRARLSVARQSRMRANADGGGGNIAVSFRLPSRSRNSSHMSGAGGGKYSARFGAYPKLLLEDDEDEDDNELGYGGCGKEEGKSRFHIHPTHPGHHSNIGWAERTAASMDRVEKRMAAVDERLAERSEQLLGLRYDQAASEP
jgi:hypothetical protein